MSPESILVPLLASLSLTLSTAESCTGGLIAKRITDVPGASSVFPGGIVSYCNRIKQGLLGVDPALIEEHTAVSSQVALQMAISACRTLHTDLAISATGYAGPGDDESVGLVYVAAAFGEMAVYRELHLSGTREEIRNAAATEALSLLLSHLTPS